MKVWKKNTEIVDNTVNNLRHEIKFEICLKNIIIIIIQFPRQILKNVDMPWQKPRHLPTAETNLERCTKTKK